MRKVLFIPIMLVFSFLAQGQNQPQEVEIGDVLTINEPEIYGFKTLDVPRANFIIKRGGVANYKALAGNEVEVTKIDTNKRGETKITLKRRDGRKFFKSFPTITASLDAALESGELTL